ncbi:MAG TPA: hypothetical protein VIT20_10755 [Propionibacteriaceae bacterium]
MPAVDTVLLPLCVGLTLLGIIITGLAWRRGRRGRVVQGVGLALAPVALYFSGLLRLLWNGAVAVGSWASKVIFSPAVWFGLSLLALCVVLWVVGGFLARRAPARVKAARTPAVASGSGQPAVTGKTSAPAKSAGSAGKGKAAAPVDEDMAEIEALLKSRGIQ